MIRPAATADILLIPVDQLADMEPPFAVRLVGRHRLLPAWLHVDRVWDFRVLEGRCGPDCPVEYDEEDDLFECACNGLQFSPTGRSTVGRVRLDRYSVLYRDETILIDLSSSGRRRR